MNLNNTNLMTNAIWAVVDSIAILGGGFRVYLKLIKKLDRIEYAIFNDGNGMKQQVQDLHTKQAEIKIDIEVLKAIREQQ